jgi:hypothetical protein
MDLAAINERVDKALAANSRAEGIVIGMAVGIFLIGAGVLFAGYWLKNPYVSAGGAVSQLLLWRPIDAILRLRRENLILQTFPSIVSRLPPAKEAEEIARLLKHLRSKG